ncbi:MAG: DNA topoisomerase 3 [Negativicutes bacterium]|nr:DNA topoisomerase 3 [Negativicutes bacterium]
MKKLIIAEKPAMAADIAKALGGFQKKAGYFEKEDTRLTWSVGHLVELVPPEVYTPAWKRWRAETLPMIPETFQLQPSNSRETQYQKIMQLLGDPTVELLVNACDAGREGELIFRYLVTMAGCRTAIKRLWISSLTAAAIRQGFAEVDRQASNEKRYFDLYQAARCRSEADWLVGMNISRAVTIGQRQQGLREVFSVGRVQTPTLAILVKREDEIAQFQQEKYWQLSAWFQAKSGAYQGQWFSLKENRFPDPAAAQRIADQIKDKTGVVLSFAVNQKNEPAPMLYDLTALQREMNRHYGYAASKTLKIAQTLYERHKLITYPRTDSRYLTPDLIPSFAQRLSAISGGCYDESLKKLEHQKLPVSGRYVNQAKVRDHHALIPTETKVNWTALTAEEKKVLCAIQQSFIAMFFPDAVWQEKEAVTQVEAETFRSKSRNLLVRGWRSVADSEKTTWEKENDLADLQPQETVRVISASITEGITQPPKRFTEGTLLGEMEHAGKQLESEAYQEAMKDHGLGTPATRAAIIDRLKEMRYITAMEKQLKPTGKGMALIHHLPVAPLRSADLTGEWEYKLLQIQEGSYQPAAFMAEMQQFVTAAVDECLRAEMMNAEAEVPLLQLAAEKAEQTEMASGSTAIAAKKAERIPAKGSRKAARELLPQLQCPLCQAKILENSKAYYCQNWKGQPPCGFTLWKTVAGKQLTAKQIEKLLRKGETGILRGFVSAKKKKFSANLRLENGKVVFDFTQAEPKSKASKKTSEPADK